MTNECEKELHDLGCEIAEREEKIVNEWKKTHEFFGRGIIEPAKRKALNKEMIERTAEILKKHSEYPPKAEDESPSE